MKSLHLADGLTLPWAESVTQTFAILAKRRAGKSYTARRLVEQILKAMLQVVVVDPKGDWWGIRSSSDGKSPGFPVVILGGERGDAPLEPSAGEVVAKLVVEECVSLLLDLSMFRKNQVAHFMTDFLETLYRLKAKEQYRTPMMLVMDEADAIAPQVPQKGEERMLGAAEDIVRRGGQRGIGCTLITQRSAVLNKNVLTQSEIMVAMRTISPQDLAAMDAWIKVHGTLEQKSVLMASLPALPTGDAWFWSPGWPTEDGIFKRVHVLPIETFDSGATPKPGEKRKEPKNLADVDLDALTRQMAATIERAKADDPKELRRQIADLRKQLSAAHKVEAPKPERVEVSVLTNEDREVLLKACDETRMAATRIEVAVASVVNDLKRCPMPTPPKGVTWRPTEFIDEAGKLDPKALRKVRPVGGTVSHAGTRRAVGTLVDPALNGVLTGPEQRILDAMAWLESVGQKEPFLSAIAYLAGYTVGAGAFNNPKARLRAAGLVVYLGDRMALTEAGRDFAKRPSVDLTAEEMQRRVLERLAGPEAKILQKLIQFYPDYVDKDALADQVGYARGCGAFNNPMGRLRSLGLVEYSGAARRAKPVLFLEEE